MGRLLCLAAALGAVGCGKVATAEVDAKATDASKDAFSCPAMQTVCADDKCANTNTDSMNCGECGNACGTGTTCGSGHCVDATLSCADIHLVDPTMPSGSYTHVADNHNFFCDMDNGPMQYEELGFGVFNVAHPGWDFVSPADMSNATVQKAFIFLFNRQAGGLDLIASFTGSNCCFKASMTANMDLELGGSISFPTTPNTTTTQCAITYSAAQYGFEIVTGTIAVTNPMAADFFTAHPYTEAAVGCSDVSNPAMFFRRHL
jgi:hypothetical protein